MEPLFPEDPTGELKTLAIELVKKAARLSGIMNPMTRNAIADFLRPMNSYYSNLIEGHDTHPIDIDRALNNDYSTDKVKRDLQKEAHAHIKVHKSISEAFRNDNAKKNPSSPNYLKEIHREFYAHLPESFRTVTSKEGEKKEVVPGKFRTTEVEVGRHTAPFSGDLPLFTERFADFYNPTGRANRSKTRRIISIAASHHRLAWIHPFLDGNGRVVRLYSDACFMHEKLDAEGLWSISRGLARTKEEYRTRLANADLTRNGNHDGRGNLSNRMLIEFCTYFLKTAIDQVEFIYRAVDTEHMLTRLKGFSDLMALKGRLRPEARHILIDVFLRGKISKPDAMRITGTSDKTLKNLTDSMIGMNLLTAKKEGITMMYHVKYPIAFSPMIFPGLYPADKEIDMTNNI